MDWNLDEKITKFSFGKMHLKMDKGFPLSGLNSKSNLGSTLVIALLCALIITRALLHHDITWPNCMKQEYCVLCV